ncbi:MAG TPA: hypothetical protein VFB12_04075 [Ktedonobacteraceae bacterium]|nr:hypothetical protein [Ktedonobacteraceae bacterium]
MHPRTLLCSRKRRSRGWLSPMWLQSSACGAREFFHQKTLFRAESAEKCFLMKKFASAAGASLEKVLMRINFASAAGAAWKRLLAGLHTLPQMQYTEG